MMNANTLTKREQIVTGLMAQDGLLGIVALWGANGLSVLTEGSDLLLVIVSEDGISSLSTTHYIQDDIRIQERRIPRSLMRERAASREDRNLLHKMMEGEIWFDPEGFLAQIRMDLLEYPDIVKQQKLLSEFSLFMKRYLQCKDFLVADQVLDAYSSVLRAIHHWARISVVEAGVHPEITVWQQVKRYNPGVYKLYEELTTSNETLRQRVELVLLACEFSIMSQMEYCCSLLIRILGEAGQPLGVQELLNHPYMSGTWSVNLPLILTKLSRKSLIKEVSVASDLTWFELEVKYTGCA